MSQTPQIPNSIGLRNRGLQVRILPGALGLDLILLSVITKVKGMKVICQDFRENVRAVLAEKGWSRKQLAEEMGVTPSYITQLLNAYHEPGLAVVEDVAIALGVSRERLVGENSSDGENGA